MSVRERRAHGTICTFYSFKGGVGRSFLLGNIGALLATWGYSVLCVDWDVEAPGLGLMFSDYLTRRVDRGLLELVEDYVADGSPEWADYTLDVTVPGPGKLNLIPAGSSEETYVRSVQEFNWVEMYKKKRLGAFLERLREEWKAHYDFILIDSRTGITDIGGICTAQMPDILVLVFTANYQNLDGVVRVAGRAAATRNRLLYDRSALHYLPVPSRIDSFQEGEKAREWSRIFADRLRNLYGNWAHKDLSSLQLIDQCTVPYIPEWSFGERLPVLYEDFKNPKTISSFIARIAALLAQQLTDSRGFVNASDTYVELARTKGMAKGSRDERGIPTRSYDIYLSFPSAESAFASRLDKALRRLKLSVFPSESVAGESGDHSEGVAAAIRSARHFVAVVGQELAGRQSAEMVEAFGQKISKILIDQEVPGRIIIVPTNIAPTTMRLLNEYFPKCLAISAVDSAPDEIAWKIASMIDTRHEGGDGDVEHYL